MTLGNRTTRSRARGGRRAWARGAAAVVPSALAATLLVPLSAGSAYAAVPPGSEISQNFNARASGSCTVDPTANPSYTASLPGAGGRSVLSRSSYRAVLAGGNPVAYLNSWMTSDTSVTTRSGSLASFVISQTGRASVQPVNAGACGSGGPLASAAPSQATEVIEPARVAGWLDLAGAVGGSGTRQVFAYVYLLPPRGAGTAVIPSQEITRGWTRRVYVPAGWSVDVRLDAQARAYLYNPASTTRASATVSASVRGTFTPAGAAVTGERGARLARRAVALPSAVSCAGSARAGVTRYAKKKAKSVTFLVNGHPVRRIKHIRRARSVTIPVPTRGPIKITAKVTPKSGKKVKAWRSYAACH